MRKHQGRWGLRGGWQKGEEKDADVTEGRRGGIGGRRTGSLRAWQEKKNGRGSPGTRFQEDLWKTSPSETG